MFAGGWIAGCHPRDPEGSVRASAQWKTRGAGKVIAMLEGWSFRLAVEDRFIIVKLAEEGATLPEGLVLEQIVQTLISFTHTYDILCDSRGLRDITSDVAEAVELLCENGARVVVRPQEAPLIQSAFEANWPVLTVNNARLPLNYEALDLAAFESRSYLTEADLMHLTDIVGPTGPSEEEWEFAMRMDPSFRRHYSALEEFSFDAGQGSDLLTDRIGAEEVVAHRVMNHTLKSIGRNSLLTEFCIQTGADNCTVTPYHSHALHSVEARDELLLARPAVIANRTGYLLHDDLAELEGILSDPRVKEGTIQNWLQRHDSVFRAMGYVNVYPQVVLQRDDGTSLRPDFILEPASRGWCDIMDIKIPRMQTVVGKRDRKTLSSYIHEVVAQLREYSAYFENDKWTRRVEDVHGIKCYRPRLIAVIGRDPKLADAGQLRRLMTAYADAEIVTFDQLLRIARTRLLI